MRWYQDPKVELLLEQLGIHWEWKRIAWSKLRIKQSLKNNARTIPLNEDNWFSIANDLDEGDDCQLPGLVVWRPEGKREEYNIADGNHRVKAIDFVGHAPEKIDAYVMMCDDPLLIDTATRLFNRKLGLGQDNTDALSNALHMLDNSPHLTIKRVARLFGLKENQIQKAKKANETSRILHNNKLPSKDICDTNLVSLNQLKQNEAVLLDAAEVVKDMKLSTTDTQQMVQRVKAKRSEAGQLREIEEIRQEIEHGLVSSRRPDAQDGQLKVQHRLRRALGNLNTVVCNNPSAEALQLTARSDLEEVRYEWEQIRDKVNRALR